MGETTCQMSGITMRVRLSLAFFRTRLLTLFTALGHDKAQSIIDQITAAYESGNGPPPGGFGFGPQHLGPPPSMNGPPMGMGPPPGGFGGPPGGFGGPPPGFGGRKSSNRSRTFATQPLTTSRSPSAFPSWSWFPPSRDDASWPWRSSFSPTSRHDAPTWNGSSPDWFP